MTTTSSTTPTYDPTSTAASLAKAYTDGAQTILTNETNDAQNTSAALTKLQTALQNFDAALTNLSSSSSTSAPSGVLAQTATFSSPGIGSASASASASAGSYQFFVQQLATASQVSYGYSGGASATGAGTLNVDLAGGASFGVDLSTADTDHDGTLSTAEIAAAINKASGNNGVVTASIVTVSGSSQLLLTSNQTGAANAASLDTSGLPAGALKTALDSGNTLSGAQDAIVWLGAQGSGIELQQASNTYSNVAGVSVTFTGAMAAGTPPVTLTVATDSSGTASNLQSFVSAYNALQSTLDSLTASGDPTNNVAAGAFADDAGVRALRSKLANIVREQVGGVSLMSYGITGNTDGTLSLDTTRLQAKLAVDPTSLGAIFGSNTLGAQSGVLGDLDKALNVWTNSANGQIAQRQASVTKQQADLASRQQTLDDQYNDAYNRYLAQFTALQTLQAQMSQNSSMFDALFGSSSSN
jgi:flagellar hook-associated protein 2